MIQKFFCLTRKRLTTLNDELSKLSVWFRVNRLSVNLKKKIYCFKPCQDRTNQTIQLLINGQKNDKVKERVFLGVMASANMHERLFKDLSSRAGPRLYAGELDHG